jgi:hypothetical protein
MEGREREALRAVSACGVPEARAGEALALELAAEPAALALAAEE